jgi:hypothetical protein
MQGVQNICVSLQLFLPDLLQATTAQSPNGPNVCSHIGLASQSDKQRIGTPSQIKHVSSSDKAIRFSKALQFE